MKTQDVPDPNLPTLGSDCVTNPTLARQENSSNQFPTNRKVIVY
jgi:hypothetical protein